MGLDMYAYKVAKDAVKEENSWGDMEYPSEELAYWRKHNALHGWMENLYREEGGDADMFNGIELELNESDILELKKVVEGNVLPETKGFFFGQDSRFDDHYKEKDLMFIKDALDAIKDGYKVYYNSSW
jgi:hypothetical protein